MQLPEQHKAGLMHDSPAIAQVHAPSRQLPLQHSFDDAQPSTSGLQGSRHRPSRHSPRQQSDRELQRPPSGWHIGVITVCPQLTDSIATTTGRRGRTAPPYLPRQRCAAGMLGDDVPRGSAAVARPGGTTALARARRRGARPRGHLRRVPQPARAHRTEVRLGGGCAHAGAVDLRGLARRRTDEGPRRRAELLRQAKATSEGTPAAEAKAQAVATLLP
jgi:hypothetical protein